MQSSVHVLTGPAGSGKTQRLLERYRRALAEGPIGGVLWLAPTQRSAADIRGRLLRGDLRACFSPGVMTFDQFAEMVLSAADEPSRPISQLIKRQVIAQLIAAAHADGKLEHFAPIADRPGLVDLCAHFISELKRLEIWPEQFRQACQRRGLEPKDRELLAIYEAYQHRLTQHKLYDGEGRFWSASELIAQGQTRPFERLQLVIVDGFTDFTRPQQRILAALARRAAELHVSLLLEEGTERRDLFAKPRQTLAELREVGAKLNVQVETLPRQQATSWPALSHIEARIFGNPRQASPAPDAARIEIIAAARSLGEIEAVGRKIKRLMLDGAGTVDGRPVPAADIAVVFRSLTEAAPLVREVFTALGIPFALEAGETLGQSRALLALVKLLELAENDWPFRDLLGTLASTYFHPTLTPEITPEAIQATEQTIRELQIASGRERLLELVERWATMEIGEEPIVADEDDELDPARQRRERRRRAMLALPILHHLEEALGKLPDRATPAAWGLALTALADATGLSKVIVPEGELWQLGRREQSAWDRLIELLADTDRQWQDLGEQPPPLTRLEFLSFLHDLLANEKIPEPHDETGRVRVLSAFTAREVRVPYLFFAGLSEKAFPPPEREDRLYSESEIERLRASGLSLVGRTERGQQEMLLFYEVLTLATRQLWLSYPALDEKAQPLLPSPYLTELENACGAAKIARDVTTDLSPLPRDEQVLSLADWRVLAVHTACEQSNEGLLAGLLATSTTQPTGENLCAGLEVTEARSRSEAFGPWDGMLTSDAARAELLKRFPPERRWSPSQLEQYAYCPHQFFLERMLGIEPLPDLALEIDYMSRGRLWHRVIANVHERVNQLCGGPASVADMAESEFLSLAETVLADAPSRPAGDPPLMQAFDELDRRLVTRWLDKYRQQSETHHTTSKAAETRPVPTHFEVSFGMKRKGRDTLSTEAPLELMHESDTVYIAGRIDRVDVGQMAGRVVFDVLDYKTGSSRGYSAASIAKGDKLQLVLYALAVQEVLLSEEDALPWRVGYWFVKDAGFRRMLEMHAAEESQLKPTDAWRGLRTVLAQRVIDLVRHIRAGEFPMFSLDEHCTSRCEFHTVCRVNQVRALEKPWPTP